MWALSGVSGVVVVQGGQAVVVGGAAPGPASALASAGFAVRRGRAISCWRASCCASCWAWSCCFARRTSRPGGRPARRWRRRAVPDWGPAWLMASRHWLSRSARWLAWRARCSRRALCAAWVSAQARSLACRACWAASRLVARGLGGVVAAAGVFGGVQRPVARWQPVLASAAVWPAAGRQGRASNRAARWGATRGRAPSVVRRSGCAACCCCRVGGAFAAWPSLRLSWASRACCWSWCRAVALRPGPAGLAGVHVQRLIGGDGPVLQRAAQRTGFAGAQGGAVGVQAADALFLRQQLAFVGNPAFQFSVALLAVLVLFAQARQFGALLAEAVLLRVQFGGARAQGGGVLRELPPGVGLVLWRSWRGRGAGLAQQGVVGGWQVQAYGSAAARQAALVARRWWAAACCVCRVFSSAARRASSGVVLGQLRVQPLQLGPAGAPVRQVLSVRRVAGGWPARRWRRPVARPAGLAGGGVRSARGRSGRLASGCGRGEWPDCAVRPPVGSARRRRRRAGDGLAPVVMGGGDGGGGLAGGQPRQVGGGVFALGSAYASAACWLCCSVSAAFQRAASSGRLGCAPLFGQRPAPGGGRRSRPAVGARPALNSPHAVGARACCSASALAGGAGVFKHPL